MGCAFFVFALKGKVPPISEHHHDGNQRMRSTASRLYVHQTCVSFASALRQICLCLMLSPISSAKRGAGALAQVGAGARPGPACPPCESQGCAEIALRLARPLPAGSSDAHLDPYQDVRSGKSFGQRQNQTASRSVLQDELAGLPPVDSARASVPRTQSLSFLRAYWLSEFALTSQCLKKVA